MIGVVGAGAFGSALAVALHREGRNVRLWARDPVGAGRRLGDASGDLGLTGDLSALAEAEVVLLCLPMQALGGFLGSHATALGGIPVACCKGIDLATGQGATALIEAALPGRTPAILTGPGFAADITAGLPTALTLACREAEVGATVQALLSTRTLRLYRTQDVTGAELGGALKNVIAIAAGVAIGAGLGESARAAIMTRGYAEMVRLASALGANVETLAGLSGLGDLILTATSDQSRNFRYGYALGKGDTPDPHATVEGVATARAALGVALRRSIDLPVTRTVHALASGSSSLADAIAFLLSRPLKPE